MKKKFSACSKSLLVWNFMIFDSYQHFLLMISLKICAKYLDNDSEMYYSLFYLPVRILYFLLGDCGGWQRHWKNMQLMRLFAGCIVDKKMSDLRFAGLLWNTPAKQQFSYIRLVYSASLINSCLNLIKTSVITQIRSFKVLLWKWAQFQNEAAKSWIYKYLVTFLTENKTDVLSSPVVF